MRHYSTTAGEMILQASITAGDTAILLDTAAGLPSSFPFTLLLDYGTSSEEVVDVTAASGTTLTVTRAQDGTVAQSHAFGAKIRHGISARDYRESREHEAATVAHGAAGAVVGTTNTQTLDNKTFQPAADHQAVVVKTRSGNTTPVLELRDHADGVFARWFDSLVEHISGSDTFLSINSGGKVSVLKRILSLRVGNDHHAITGDVTGTPTGRFIRLLSGATELFSVAADGTVAAPNVFTIPAASLKATANQNLTTGTYPVMVFGATEVSRGITTNPAAGTVTVTRAGSYQIQGTVCFGANVTGIRQAAIAINGSIRRLGTSSPGAQATATVSGLLTLGVGDVVTLLGFQNSGSTLGLDATYEYTSLSVVYV